MRPENKQKSQICADKPHRNNGYGLKKHWLSNGTKQEDYRKSYRQ